MRVGFAITQHCNLRCPHCIRDDVVTVRSLPTSLFQSVVDESLELFGDVGVSLTGGEPLLHPELHALVAHLAARGVPWRIVTNGWHTRRAMPVLEGHPPEFVRLSLSGVDQDSHDEIRGRGSFRRVLQSAALLTARRIQFSLSLIVDRRTRPRLEEAASLATGLGAWQLQFVLPQPVQGSLDLRTELPLEQWVDVRDEVRRLRGAGGPTRMELAYGAPFDGPEAPCPTKSHRHLYVDARGRLCSCCQLSDYGPNDREVVADLAQVSLREAWLRHRKTVDELARKARKRDDPADPLDPFPCLRCARACGKMPRPGKLTEAGVLPASLPVLASAAAEPDVSGRVGSESG